MRISRFIKTRAKKSHKRIATWEDKLSAREIAASVGCPLPDLYQVADNSEAVDFDQLPDSYVIKWNNLSCTNGVLLIKNGRNLRTGKNIEANEIKHLVSDATKYYDPHGRRANSIHLIKPKILIEELLTPESDSNGALCLDYKCNLICGRLHSILLISGRFSKISVRQHFDKNWNPIIIKNYDKQSTSENITAPKCLPEIVYWAERLGSLWNDTYLRIDFYATNRGAVFGEFTFNPAAGNGFVDSADIEMGRLLNAGND
jgi:hypothetical protein